MSDKKSLAIILGTIVGVAAVAATVSVYLSHHREPVVRDVSDVLEQARQTVQKLDKAVEFLHHADA